MKRPLAVIAVLIGLGALADTYVAPITFPNLPAGTDLTNFPLLVRFAPNAPGSFDYEKCPSAMRLSFNVQGESEGLPFEIECWDATGTSSAWVGVPRLTSGTALEMRWYSAGDDENPAPGCVNDAGSVWARADYIGVWHLNGRNADGKWPDSTTNALHATPYSASIPSADASTSPLGGTCAANVSGSTVQSTGGMLLSAAQLANFDFGGKLTISCWARRLSGGGSRLISSARIYYNGFTLSMSTGGMHFMCYPFDTGGSPSTTYCIGKDLKPDGNNPYPWQSGETAVGAWHYLDVHFRQNGTFRGYENGTFWCDTAGTGVTVASVQNPRANGIGLGSFADNSSAFGGCFDEMRLSTVERPAAWPQVEYDMQKRTDYLAFGTTHVISDKPLMTFEVVTNGVRFVQARLTASSLGSGATSGTFYVGAAPQGTSVTTQPVAGTDILHTFKHLSGNAEYDYVVAFTNDLGAGTAAQSGTFATQAEAARYDWASTVTVAPHAGTAALANFPLPLRLSPARLNGFDYAQTGPDGGDIRFFDADGAVVPHEIDGWNTNGETVVWVSVANYSGQGGANVPITMRWGADDGAAQPTVDSAAVWTRANYVGVWHLSVTNADGSCADASGHGLTAMRRTDATYPQRDESAFADDGRLLGGALNIGGDTVGDGLVVPSDLSQSVVVATPFTFSGWSKRASSGNGRFLSGGVHYSHVNMTIGDRTCTLMGENTQYFSGTAAQSTAGAWHHYAGVFDNYDSQSYIDGVLLATGYAQIPGNQFNFANGIGLGTFTDWTKGRSGDKGYQPLNGCIDEMRIRNTGSTADWLAAEKATVLTDAATFSAARDASGESGMSVVPTVPVASFALLGDTGVTIEWFVDWAGSESDTVTLDCEYGLNPDNLDWCETLATDAIGRGSAAWTQRLLPNRVYWMRLRATGGNRVTRTALVSVTTRSGTSAVDEAQPVLSVTAPSGIQCDRFTLSGTLTDGIGQCAGATVTVTAGDRSEACTVAADGSWSLTLTGLAIGTEVAYRVDAATPFGHYDRLPEATVTTASSSDVDYVWAATGRMAWTNDAAWTKSLLGAPAHPGTGAKSVTFPAHAAATATVDAVTSVGSISFRNLDAFSLSGLASGASLEVRSSVDSPSIFAAGAAVAVTAARLYFEKQGGLALGDGLAIALRDGTSFGSGGALHTSGSRIDVLSAEYFNGVGCTVNYSAVTATLENAAFTFDARLDAAATSGKPGSVFTFRGTRNWLNFNKGMNGYYNDAGFWSSCADTELRFELPVEPLEKTPVFCHEAVGTSASNRPMGRGAGTGRLVFSVPKASPISHYRKALEIPLVAWSSEGIDTNRVAFGAVAHPGDTFAYTWPANAAADALPTGIVYRHAAVFTGTVITVQ